MWMLARRMGIRLSLFSIAGSGAVDHLPLTAVASLVAAQIGPSTAAAAAAPRS